MSCSPAVISVSVAADGPALQDALAEKTGQRIVPNIFINGEHLGGNSELQAANNDGSLATKMAA